MACSWYFQINMIPEDLNISDPSQRFDLWARSEGLFASGHDSLDYRYRDIATLSEYAYRVLNNLAETIPLGEFSLSTERRKPII